MIIAYSLEKCKCIFSENGNRKVDGIPLLKCFGSIWFKKLKDKIKEYEKKQVSNHYGLAKRTFKRKLNGKFNNKKVKKPENCKNLTYEPTNISITYDSMYFKWIRVKEYSKETEDIYLDKAITEAKIIMNS